MYLPFFYSVWSKVTQTLFPLLFPLPRERVRVRGEKRMSDRFENPLYIIEYLVVPEA